MPIKNYTTTVDVYTSLGQIQNELAKGGATKIMVDYDHGQPVSISFVINGPAGLRGYVLPAPVEGTLRVFQQQKVKADRERAQMTAWRNIHDWIFTQMALCKSCDVPVDQVFLPYLADKTGRTLYDVYASGKIMLTSEND